MSLAIDPGKIAAILLADGWHEVESGTVDYDAFEIHYPDETSYIAQPKAESTGITWKETHVMPIGVIVRTEYFAPLNHVLAVRYSPVGHR